MVTRKVTEVASLSERCLRDLMYFLRGACYLGHPMTDKRSSLPTSPIATLNQINLAIKGQDV